MPGMGWTALLNSPSDGAATAVASFTSAADISFSPQFTLPANFAVNGTSLTLRAFGVLSSTGTPTYNLGFYWGGVAGTALATTGAIATGTGVTNVPWRLELDVIIRSKGSSGTAMSSGFYLLGTSVSAFASPTPMPPTALATVSIDTTASKIITVGATCSANSASNTITCHGFKIFSDAL